MEVYSAFVEQTDYEVGRLIKEIRSRPGEDNTLIFYIVGDNGGNFLPERSGRHRRAALEFEANGPLPET